MKLELAADPATLKAAAAATSAASTMASMAVSDWSVAVFGVPLAVVLAGFAGAVIALSFLPPERSFVRMLGSVSIGTVTAAYTTPLAAVYLDGAPQIGLAFAIGLSAKAAIPMVPAWIRDVRDAFKRRYGGGA